MANPYTLSQGAEKQNAIYSSQFSLRALWLRSPHLFVEQLIISPCYFFTFLIEVLCEDRFKFEYWIKRLNTILWIGDWILEFKLRLRFVQWEWYGMKSWRKENWSSGSPVRAVETESRWAVTGHTLTTSGKAEGLQGSGYRLEVRVHFRSVTRYDVSFNGFSVPHDLLVVLSN